MDNIEDAIMNPQDIINPQDLERRQSQKHPNYTINDQQDVNSNEADQIKESKSSDFMNIKSGITSGGQLDN